MRLQRYLSRAGIASRRASERLIEAGRVRVDGRVVTRLGTKVDPEHSRVFVDGRRVRLPPTRWIAVHKPPGVLCSRGDPSGRPTLYDSLPDVEDRALFHVGRLDFMSEGLVLLTNDGEMAHRLLHPSGGTPRRYDVSLIDPVPGDVPARLLAGVLLEDGPAIADRAAWLPGPAAGGRELRIELHEGRNREIRRLMEALGVRIRRLRRISFGPIELGDLEPGEARVLTRGEIETLCAPAKRRAEAGRAATQEG